MPEFSRMAKYQGSVEYRRVDGVTVAASFATVEIRDSGGPGAKVIYSDEAGAGHLNPFQLDANGWGEFYVRPDDAEFDMWVQAPAGEFATFTQSALRASLSGRKKFYVRDYADIAAAIADLTLIGEGGTIVVERDFQALGQISIAGMTGVVIEGINPDVLITAPPNLGSSLIEASNCTNCHVKDLRLDGDAANQVANAANIGISVFTSVNPLLENVQVFNCMSDGFLFDASTDLRATNCVAQNNNGHGFVHGNAGDRAVRPYLINCRAIGNGDPTIVAANYPRLQGFDFEPGCDGMLLQGCYATLNKGGGILVGSEGASYTNKAMRFIDCHTESNGQDAAGTYAGLNIYIQNGHPLAFYKDILIKGGTFEDEDEYGILIDGANLVGQGEITDVRIDDVVAKLGQNYGIRIAFNCTDVRVTNSKAYNNGNDGVGVRIGISAQGVGGAYTVPTDRVSFSDCESYDDRGGGALQDIGFALSHTDDCRISGCTTRGNVTRGYSYMTNSFNTQFEGNHDL